MLFLPDGIGDVAYNGRLIPAGNRIPGGNDILQQYANRLVNLLCSQSRRWQISYNSNKHLN